MNVRTQSVTINAAPETVFQYVSRPDTLPEWAPAFAPSIRQEGERWLISRGSEQTEIRLLTDATFGIVDIHVTDAKGRTFVSRSRVVANESGSEFIFTLFQAPGMPDEVFQGQVEGMVHEFATLRRLLER